MKNEVIVPVLNDEYKVIVCWGTSEEITRVMKKWQYKNIDVETSMFSSRGVCFSNPECHPIIALPSKPKTPTEIATLAHEAVHAVGEIHEKIGDTAIGEIFAHSVGAIVRKVLSTNG